MFQEQILFCYNYRWKNLMSSCLRTWTEDQWFAMKLHALIRKKKHICCSRTIIVLQDGVVMTEFSSQVNNAFTLRYMYYKMDWFVIEEHGEILENILYYKIH